MPPPKAKLHSRTGRLKTINKTYSSPLNSNSSSANRNNRNTSNTSTNSSSTQTDPNSISSNSSINISSSSSSTSGSSSNNTASSSITDSLAIQQFELELCWCIQSMEKSLESGNLAAKQAQDTEKTIRLLKSSSQPMVKKRQIMQTAFGDYRKKMLEEEKRLRLGSRSIQFVDNNPDNNKKAASNSGAAAASKSHFVKKALTATLGDKNFQFNFPVTEIEKLTLHAAVTNDGDIGVDNNDKLASSDTTSTANDNNLISTTDKQLNTLKSPSNENVTLNSQTVTTTTTTTNLFVASKIHASDNSFKFNFKIN